ncbi:MAG: exodeoxyribonuclease V subunit alpha [Balneolaceae bacterium]
MKALFKKLEELHQKKEVSLLELEFGRFLYSLDKTVPEQVVLAGISCVQKQINGHICCSISDIISNPVYQSLLETDTNEESLSLDLKKAKIVGKPGETKPLILDGGNLYLQKLWKYEQELADFLNKKSIITHSLDEGLKEHVDQIFSEDPSRESLQKIAVFLSLVKDLVIISGRPGTGKTYTIKRIVEALNHKDKKSNIALATPTGKAAQRLNESFDVESSALSTNFATTIHKLLQSRGASGSFKYNENNKLPFDVLIIDEASMLDINLWIRLIRALPEHSKLILLGDKNQLASVEAGSILEDICSGASINFSNTLFPYGKSKIDSINVLKPINDCIVELTTSYRFEEKSGIGIFSELINSDESEEVLRLLKNDSYPEVNIAQPTNKVINELIQDFVIHPFLNGREVGFNFELLKKNQILCALRKGPFGVEKMNELAEKSLKKVLGISVSGEWYEGRPILITRNNSLLRVRNGELGICKRDKQSGLFEIEFEEKEKPTISVSRIQDYEPAFATTIHKSQGSEYEHVSIMLSNQSNPLLSKQLLYTAVTRARESVLVIASESVITSTVQKNVVRRSGLRDKIWTL